MTEWLDEEQTSDFSRWEDILRAVKFPGDWTVTVHLNPFGCRRKSKEQPIIATELSGVIADEISHPKVWLSSILSFGAMRFNFKGRAPTAAQSYDQLEGNSPGSGRLFFSPGGSFSPADAAAALRVVISKKLQKKSYATISSELGLRALYLLIYYHNVIIKNAPNLDVDPAAVAECAVTRIASGFDAVFALIFPAGDADFGRTVYRVEITIQQP